MRGTSCACTRSHTTHAEKTEETSSRAHTTHAERTERTKVIAYLHQHRAPRSHSSTLKRRGQPVIPAPFRIISHHALRVRCVSFAFGQSRSRLVARIASRVCLIPVMRIASRHIQYTHPIRLWMHSAAGSWIAFLEAHSTRVYSMFMHVNNVQYICSRRAYCSAYQPNFEHECCQPCVVYRTWCSENEICRCVAISQRPGHHFQRLTLRIPCRDHSIHSSAKFLY